MTAIQHFSDLVNYFYQKNTALSPLIEKLQSKKFIKFDIEFDKFNNTLLLQTPSPKIKFSFENDDCVKTIDGKIVFQSTTDDVTSILLHYLPIYNGIVESEASDITSEIFCWQIVIFSFVYFLGSYLIK